MKNQQVNNKRKFRLGGLLAILAMLTALTCCFAFTVSADGGDVPDGICTGAEFSDLELVNGYWTKTYDGTTEIDPAGITLTVEGATSVTVTRAQFNSKDVDSAREITVWYSVDGTAAELEYSVAAKITPRELTWGDKNATAVLDFNPALSEYTNISVSETAQTLSGYLAGIVNGDTVAIQSIGKASVSAVTASETKTLVQATCDNANYTVASLPVVVSFRPVVITEVIWSTGDASCEFVYGDDGIYQITATGVYGDGRTCALNVVIKDGTKVYSLRDAAAKKLYGGVKKGENDTTYVVYAEIVNGALYQFSDTIGEDQFAKNVKIKKAVYTVTLEDRVFSGEGDLSTGSPAPIRYQLSVSAQNLPAEVLKALTYSYYQAQSLVATNSGVALPGAYTVKVALAPVADGEFENYAISGDLEASLVILQDYIKIGAGDLDALMFLYSLDGKGLSADLIMPKLTIPESIDRKAMRGFHVYEAYTLKIDGAAEGETFKLVIPVKTSLRDDMNCHELKVSDLYIYDGMNTLTPAEKSYTVEFDGSQYTVVGLSGAEITFVIAPAYDAPFWVTAPGIALIILLVLLVLLLMFLIGLKLYQIEKSGTNPILVIDTEGDVPEFVPVEITDKIDDPDACLEESIDELAEALSETVEAEEEALEDVDASEEVADAIEEMLEDAAAVELTSEEDEADLADVDQMTEKMAENTAEALKDTEAAEDDASADEDAVNEAVEEAMAENFNESADAAEAIALIEEEAEEAPAEEVVEVEAAEEAPATEESDEDDDDNDDDNDNDDNDNDNDNDDEDDGSFAGFGAMPLSFIDAVAEAEQYNDMLARESRGEIRIVTRYRRSYQSRLAQSQGSVQDYYNEIKNLLLSYKGVKNRISWNYEAFNLGRTHLAKFNAKTRTLYVYMALDPEQLAESKYVFKDMSSKKKYASVPVLMKIKGDRKFKHALEMIALMCEEKLGLQKKKVVEEVDYRLPHMTTEELVNQGYVKKMVAAIPLNDEPAQAASTEETQND